MQSQHKTCISSVFICICCVSLTRIVLIVMQVHHSPDNQGTALLQKHAGAPRSDYTKLVRDTPTLTKTSKNTDTHPERRAAGKNITTGPSNVKSLPQRTTRNKYQDFMSISSPKKAVEVLSRSKGVLYLDGYATVTEYRNFAKMLFPELEQREYKNVKSSRTTKKDILFIGIGQTKGDVQNFKGIKLLLEGEPSYQGDTENDCYYLGPTRSKNPRHLQFFYAQFASTVAGLHRLIEPRTAGHGKNFLLYRSKNCIAHREQAFYNVCENMKGIRGATCHATKCFGGYKMAHVHTETGYWVDNSKKGKYRFELAMDKTNMRGYVSEKILNAFMAGSVPIYYGTTDVFKLFNRNAFIFYDIENPSAAIEKIQYLENNHSAYSEILSQPILSAGALEEYFSLSDSVADGKLKRRIRDMVLINV